MARSFIAASSELIDLGTPSALDFTGAFTISVLAKAASFPALGTNYAVLFGKGYDGTKEQYIGRFSGANFGGANDGNNYFHAFSFNGATSPGIEYLVTGNMVTGTWYQISYGWDGSTWFIYVNGASVGTPQGAQSAPQHSTEHASIGSEILTGSPARFFDGSIAEAAAWDAALTAGEHAVLGKNYSPLFVRPGNLVFYDSLLRAGQEVIGGVTGTYTGTAVVPHPRIIMPSSQRMRRFGGIIISAGAGIAAGMGAANAFSFNFTTTASVLIPDGDSAIGSWLNELGGTTLAPSIDETAPNVSDYIISSSNPASDICKVSLSNPGGAIIQPLAILYQYGKQGVNTINLRVRLMEGTTEIALWQHNDIPVGPVTVEQVLTSPQFASIVDPTNLFLEFKASV